jgi:hypothetical protein
LSINLQRRLALRLISGGALCAGLGGCGTIFYPERIGQPHGPLDWKVVALDTVGLLLFLVPGVIAFIVDFHNGTIYLPTEQIPYDQAPALSRKVPLEPEKRSLGDIESAVNHETGLDLSLAPGTYLTRQLQSLADYPAASKQLAMDLQMGTVRCQSPDR